MRAQGLETLFPKYLTPHTAYDTNKVNICVDFFLFSKENPEIQRFVEKSPIFLKIYCNSKQVKQIKVSRKQLSSCFEPFRQSLNA